MKLDTPPSPNPHAVACDPHSLSMACLRNPSENFKHNCVNEWHIWNPFSCILFDTNPAMVVCSHKSYVEILTQNEMFLVSVAP